jgi:hypothetical protein
MQAVIDNIHNARQLSDLFAAIEAVDDVESFERTIANAVNDNRQSPPGAEAVAEATVQAIDSLYPDKPIKTDEDVRVAKALQSYLNGLYCTASNRRYSDGVIKAVYGLLCRVQRRLHNHTKRQVTKDPVLSLLSRYVCLGEAYTQADQAKVYAHLNEAGLLRKRTNRNGTATVYVIGLYTKVRDNVYTIDRRGREHPTYLDVTLPQAHATGFPFRVGEKDSEALLNAIPEMSDSEDYSETFFGGGKGTSRRPSVDTEKLIDALKCIDAWETYRATPLDLG